MLYTNKKLLAARLLAISAIVLTPSAADAATAGDISAAQVLNTSPLWADSGSFHTCNVVNVSTASINVAVELISATGTQILAQTYSLTAGNSAELASTGTYSGFARCRFTSNYASATIRVNLAIFHLTNATYQTYAVSEAR